MLAVHTLRCVELIHVASSDCLKLRAVLTLKEGGKEITRALLEGTPHSERWVSEIRVFHNPSKLLSQALRTLLRTTCC